MLIMGLNNLFLQCCKAYATREALREHIRLSADVTGISRVGFDRVKTKVREMAAFEIRYQIGAGSKTVLADTVIDATGKWSTPNPADANGINAIGEADASTRIAYGMPDVLGRDRARYRGQTVAVVGARHSAVGALIELVPLKEEAPGTRIIWIIRGDNNKKAFGGDINDKLAARGSPKSELSRSTRGGTV
jgi:thioredoxin reductase